MIECVFFVVVVCAYHIYQIFQSERITPFKIW